MFRKIKAPHTDLPGDLGVQPVIAQSLPEAYSSKYLNPQIKESVLSLPQNKLTNQKTVL